MYAVENNFWISQGKVATSYRWGGQMCKIFRSNFVKIHAHTHPFNGSFSGTTWVSRYQKGKTNLDFTEARDSEWQWHQLGYMQVCTSLQTDNHASTPPLSFLQAECPSCRPTNSVKALNVQNLLKLVTFWRDIQRIKRWTFFVTRCIYVCWNRFGEHRVVAVAVTWICVKYVLDSW